ncbi:hypothetical protein B0H15DRAFT_436438 [Mycena belliarum]|uniref:Uncharacterized protein n=1 Tax=Mycena belliarum TaxID=1033014 RepID=A0AAD6TX30_9AGAR|nr:hypothetical protein B0H15DRAFT_436438 [Mycena belliae]
MSPSALRICMLPGLSRTGVCGNTINCVLVAGGSQSPLLAGVARNPHCARRCPRPGRQLLMLPTAGAQWDLLLPCASPPSEAAVHSSCAPHCL